MDVKKLAELGGGGGEKSLVVQRQIMLPWSDAFRISTKSVLLRLGRAGITATGIILGVAFLSYVWSDHIFSEGVEKARVQQEQSVAQAAETVRGTAGSATTEASQKQTAEQLAATAKEKAARQLWLVIMSLLVCGIGITNSMLMSVTERFQEIGTMKCLGALDSFIVRLFLIEAAVVGVLGSVAGLIVGSLFVILFYGIKYGFGVVGQVNWAQLSGYMVASVVIGAVLSLMAAIPPAIRAAQMPPAAALRSEI
ncbi:MAG TPA: FtsX-like permease family protein [Armatimonadota bacterium]|jgi:ABC-type lipoprotein release transport system permease subunit